MVASPHSEVSGMPGTAFVLGPGRSGTTLLYKLLCLHPEVAYLSNLETRLSWLPMRLTGRFRLRQPQAKVGHWFNDHGNAYLVSRPWMQRFVPNPVEGERVYARLGMPPFPDTGNEAGGSTAARFRRAFAQVRAASGARVLVSKRTANNRRIPVLEKIFDGPLYVNLLRDGRDVAVSLSRVAWWPDHRLWWDTDQRTPAEIGGDALALCARNWTEEVEEIETGLSGVDRARILDVRFEELLAAPVSELSRIYRFLGLTEVEGLEPAIRALGLEYRPGSWSRNLDTNQVALVEQIQGPYLQRLGYA